jgi:hypothetical protein
VDGPVSFTDVSGNVCTGNQRLVNVATFIDGCRLADPGSADMPPWVERIPSEATDTAEPELPSSTPAGQGSDRAG